MFTDFLFQSNTESAAVQRTRGDGQCMEKKMRELKAGVENKYSRDRQHWCFTVEALCSTTHKED